MKKITENTKITLTIGQLRRLVKESTEPHFDWDMNFQFTDAVVKQLYDAGLVKFSPSTTTYDGWFIVSLPLNEPVVGLNEYNKEISCGYALFSIYPTFDGDWGLKRAYVSKPGVELNSHSVAGNVGDEVLQTDVPDMSRSSAQGLFEALLNLPEVIDKAHEGYDKEVGYLRNDLYKGRNISDLEPKIKDSREHLKELLDKKNIECDVEDDDEIRKLDKKLFGPYGPPAFTNDKLGIALNYHFKLLGQLKDAKKREIQDADNPNTMENKLKSIFDGTALKAKLGMGPEVVDREKLKKNAVKHADRVASISKQVSDWYSRPGFYSGD